MTIEKEKGCTGKFEKAAGVAKFAKPAIFSFAVDFLCRVC